MNNINQHAHDIAHAVFRVATLIHNQKLRTEIENAAVKFLANYEEALHPNAEHVACVFDKLERMISLAESTKEMKDINAQVLKRELSKLLNNLKTRVSPERTIDDINLSGYFENSDEEENEKPESTENTNSDINSYKDSEEERKKTNPIDYSKVLNTELTARQYSILYKIREIQTCRLRDLMATFPDISERTIRNEVKVLIDHGLVQRIGGGGPNSYFESMEVGMPMQKVSRS